MNTKNSNQILNIILLSVIPFLVYQVYQKYADNNEQEPIQEAHLVTYEAQVFYQSPTVKLRPYDFQLPLVAGVDLIADEKGKMLFKTLSGIEIELKSKSHLTILENGIKISMGTVTINNDAGVIPNDFRVYKDQEQLKIKHLPYTIEMPAPLSVENIKEE